jgi:carbamoyl-phosphate synthase large subunit
LLEAFMAAVHHLGGRVLAADVDPLAPALYLADKAIRMPTIASGDYVEALCEVVAKETVGIVVPTIDTELGILADLRPRLQGMGCLGLVSDPGLVRVTSDKLETFIVFSGANVRVTPTWAPSQLADAELPERMIVKPRGGSASQNVHFVGPGQLREALEMVPNPIVQTEIDAPEITIDALLSLEGVPIHYVPRLRLRTLAGESIQGRTIARPDLETWIVGVLELIGRLGGRGPLTLQAFLTEEPTLSEVNPRFGGGYPLALAAGAAYPEWILAMATGQIVTPRLGEFKEGLYMTRTHREIFFEDPYW